MENVYKLNIIILSILEILENSQRKFKEVLLVMMQDIVDNGGKSLKEIEKNKAGIKLLIHFIFHSNFFKISHPQFFIIKNI